VRTHSASAGRAKTTKIARTVVREDHIATSLDFISHVRSAIGSHRPQADLLLLAAHGCNARQIVASPQPYSTARAAIKGEARVYACS